MVCCVVAPFEARADEHNCHFLAGLVPAAAQAGAHTSHSRHHGAHGVAASQHDADSHDAPPAHACCDLAGKANVTVSKSIDFDAQPVVVLAALTLLVPDFPKRSELTPTPVELHEHSPPLFLRNASFLI
jgi:hypothetical protein